ncbi:GNAT family N-acetyltransferase [Mycetocola zhujimingii]|uniref:GNAT family N-acetyltransferase n=1 Tax=Mycetocola zhujimingii TaxID=2079792 RepID=A0A2U1THB6_9MICO|nr:GNAT family N-acetyltransferase [Mycetocola zhujimingii]PWC08289.1 GNAT family N-acetyltransferase [Mycetocola zhujimingii]
MVTHPLIDEVSIDELTIPATLDSPDGRSFVEMVNLRNRVEEKTLGSNDLAQTPKEYLPGWHDRFAPKRLFLARLDGRIVGYGVYEWQPEEGATAAFLEIEVDPDFRRRGIGTALLRVLEALADSNGLRVLQPFSMHRPSESDDVVVPPTGFGAVDRDSPAARFAEVNGYRLEQVARVSRIDLPVDPEVIANNRRVAESHATGYRVVQWVGRCPEQWLADMARLHQRMSTDAPAAGLEFAEEQWDEARVANLDDRNEAAGRTNLTSAALDIASARLVGYTDIAIPEAEGKTAIQEDTLVLREHRGHRLGMLLKLANLEQLMRVSPETPAIITFNAEENRPMLSVNEAVGFIPVAYEASWKKVV